MAICLSGLCKPLLFAGTVVRQFKFGAQVSNSSHISATGLKLNMEQGRGFLWLIYPRVRA